MTAAEIIHLAKSEGLTLSLSSSGGIRLQGTAKAIDTWRALVRDNKAAIVECLRGKTFDQLSPAERSRWCMDHELTRPGHRCPHKGKLDGCELWAAITRRQAVNDLF